jgi:hypothetical protein
MEKPSKKFELNMADIKAQAKSAFIFLIPSILSFLTTLALALSGVVAKTEQQLLVLTITKWGLDQLTGLLRKYNAGK